MKRTALSLLLLGLGCFSVPDNQATIRFRFVLLEEQANGSIGALLCAGVPPVGEFINSDVASLAIVAKSSRGIEVKRLISCSYSPGSDLLINTEEELGLFEADLPADSYEEILLSLQDQDGNVIAWKSTPTANFEGSIDILLDDKNINLRPEETRDLGPLFEGTPLEGAVDNELKIFPQLQ